MTPPLQARHTFADGTPALAILLLDTSRTVASPDADRTRYFTLEQASTALALVYPDQEPVFADADIRRALVQAARHDLLTARTELPNQELVAAYTDVLLRKGVFRGPSHTDPSPGVLARALTEVENQIADDTLTNEQIADQLARVGLTELARIVRRCAS